MQKKEETFAGAVLISLTAPSKFCKRFCTSRIEKKHLPPEYSDGRREESLEVESAGQLEQTRQVVLRCDGACLRVADRYVRISKLNTVKRVEGFNPEIERHILADIKGLV